MKLKLDVEGGNWHAEVELMVRRGAGISKFKPMPTKNNGNFILNKRVNVEDVHRA